MQKGVVRSLVTLGVILALFLGSRIESGLYKLQEPSQQTLKYWTVV